jgi:alpha-L-arabinofuranosidase
VDVSATLSEDLKTLYLAVINRHDAEQVETEISIEGWLSGGKVGMIRLDGEHYMSENTFDSPNRIGIVEEEIDWPSRHATFRLAEHSVTILEFHQR